MSNIEKAKISKDAVREYIEKILDITEDIQKISEATYATTETEDNRIDRNAFIDLLRQLEVGLYKVQIDLEEKMFMMILNLPIQILPLDKPH